MKINRYEVNIQIEKGIVDRGNNFTKIELDVLKTNETRVVLDDEYFTVLHKNNKDHWNTSIDRPLIRIYSKDNCYGSAIYYSLYTYKVKSPEKIKKEIRDEITKKFGAFLGNVDLTIIK